MELRLVYSEQAKSSLRGAFLPGNSPEGWLKEIAGWNIAVSKLQAYVLPKSIHDINAGGLFILFEKEHPDVRLVRHPYTSLAERLFIPLNAVLYPVVSEAELKGLLRWDLQIFHPVIGLVGFEKTLAIKLSTLVKITAPQSKNWSLAHAGVEQPPLLRQIALEPQEMLLGVLDTIKADIGSKNLSDIPPTNSEETEKQRQQKKVINFLEKTGLYFLLLLTFIGGVLVAILAIFFGRDQHQRANTSKGGLLQRFEQWINSRLTDLEKQRDSELKRLVDLFDRDMDEALQYAIPLSSPYLDRGKAAPTSKLSRHSLQLNLGRLGGGGSVDAWNLGDYHNVLRRRYEKSANDAIADGNFKRAAYVYAHLLGNFHSAANVLQQGKLYREAALIYKDHLKNSRMAAECLEKGGLLNEAIPLYLELKETEKAGDLYQQLGRQDQASHYYRQKQDELTNAKNYRKAATLTRDKLHDHEAAQMLLLQGWKDNNEPEACLSDWFETQHNLGQSLPHEVRSIYGQHVPGFKKTAFLNVLNKLSRQFPEEQLGETSLAIAYDIVHQQLPNGDTSGLKLINQFLPGDRLLHADANRFIHNQLKQPPVITEVRYIELRKDIQWFHLQAFHDQLIGLSHWQSDVQFVQADWEDRSQYQFMFRYKPEIHPFYLLADQSLSDQVLLIGEHLPMGIDLQMEDYTYFDRPLNFKGLNLLPSHCGLACCINGKKGVSVLHYDIHGLILSHYNFAGELQQEISNLYLNQDGVNPGRTRFDPHAMIWRKDHFYYFMGSVLLRITYNGEFEVLELPSTIRKFSVTGPHMSLKIAVLTDEGCLLVTPTLKEMHISSALFAQDIAATDVRLLTDNRLVITEGMQATIFDITLAEPVKQSTIKTKNPITTILSIPKRHHIAFLESDQRISIYSLE